jgi:hypothetical protein
MHGATILVGGSVAASSLLGKDTSTARLNRAERVTALSDEETLL